MATIATRCLLALATALVISGGVLTQSQAAETKDALTTDTANAPMVINTARWTENRIIYLEDDTETISITYYYKSPDRIRVETPVSIYCQNGTQQYFYDIPYNSYRQSEVTGPSPDYTKELLLFESYLLHWKALGSDISSTESPSAYQGKPCLLVETQATAVTLENGQQFGQYHQWAYLDPHTRALLALKTEHWYPDGKRLFVVRTLEFQYNIDIEDELFHCIPPAGAIEASTTPTTATSPEASTAGDPLTAPLSAYRKETVTRPIEGTVDSWEAWYKLPDKLRNEFPGMIEIVNGNTRTTYDKIEMVYREEPGDPLVLTEQFFTAERELHYLRAQYQDIAQREETTLYQGSVCPVIDIVVPSQQPDGLQKGPHVRLILDPTTKYVLCKEVEQYDVNGNVVEREVVAYDYSEVADDIFTLTLPPNAFDAEDVRDLQSAVDNIASIHFMQTQTSYLEDGRAIDYIMEGWYKNPDKYRADYLVEQYVNNGEDTIYIDKEEQTYQRTVTSATHISDMFSPLAAIQRVRSLDIDAEVSRTVGEYQGTTYDMITIDYTARQTDDGGRIGRVTERIYLDQQSKVMKVRVEERYAIGGDHILERTITEHDYSEVSDDLFQLTPPAGFREITGAM